MPGPEEPFQPSRSPELCSPDFLGSFVDTARMLTCWPGKSSWPSAAVGSLPSLALPSLRAHAFLGRVFSTCLCLLSFLWLFFSTYLGIRLTSGMAVAVLLGMTKWPGWPRAHLLRLVIILVMCFRWEGRGTPAGDVPLGP